MKATRIFSVVLATSLMGTLGCAQNVPNAPAAQTPQTPEIPLLQTVANGPVAPDQLLVDNFQTMVNGNAMSMDEIRKKLPARISAADAAKMLVKLDMSKVAKDGDFETQQWRGFGRGFGGRGFIGRGFAGGLGFRNRFLGLGGLGFGGLGFFPYSSYYFPYYYNAGYYYPWGYNYANAFCSPYLYGFGGAYYPFTYGCGLGGYGGYGLGYGLGYGGFGCW